MSGTEPSTDSPPPAVVLASLSALRDAHVSDPPPPQQQQQQRTADVASLVTQEPAPQTTSTDKSAVAPPTPQAAATETAPAASAAPAPAPATCTCCKSAECTESCHEPRLELVEFPVESVHDGACILQGCAPVGYDFTLMLHHYCPNHTKPGDNSNNGGSSESNGNRKGDAGSSVSHVQCTGACEGAAGLGTLPLLAVLLVVRVTKPNGTTVERVLEEGLRNNSPVAFNARTMMATRRITFTTAGRGTPWVLRFIACVHRPVPTCVSHFAELCRLDVNVRTFSKKSKIERILTQPSSAPLDLPDPPPHALEHHRKRPRLSCAAEVTAVEPVVQLPTSFLDSLAMQTNANASSFQLLPQPQSQQAPLITLHSQPPPPAHTPQGAFLASSAPVPTGVIPIQSFHLPHLQPHLQQHLQHPQQQQQQNHNQQQEQHHQHNQQQQQQHQDHPNHHPHHQQQQQQEHNHHQQTLFSSLATHSVGGGALPECWWTKEVEAELATLFLSVLSAGAVPGGACLATRGLTAADLKFIHDSCVGEFAGPEGARSWVARTAAELAKVARLWNTESPLLFAGLITRQQAEHALAHSPPGTFLLRLSSGEPGEIIVAFVLEVPAAPPPQQLLVAGASPVLAPPPAHTRVEQCYLRQDHDILDERVVDRLLSNKLLVNALDYMTGTLFCKELYRPRGRYFDLFQTAPLALPLPHPHQPAPHSATVPPSPASSQPHHPLNTP